MFYVKSFRDVFSSFKADSSLFIYHNNNITIVLVYVDNVLVAGNNINFIWGLLEQFELQKILALYIIFLVRGSNILTMEPFLLNKNAHMTYS